MSPPKPAKPERGARRADWLASRERILDAAAEQFARRGYRRTSTQDLAEAAGVAEATIFRHFSTKADLFEQAVIRPLRTSVTELADRRRDHSAEGSTEWSASTFFDEMIEQLGADSGLLIAALAALTFESETAEFTQISGAFSELLSYMDEVFELRAAQRGYDVDPKLASRILLATAIGLTLGDRLLFTDADRPTHEVLVSEVVKVTTYGIVGRANSKGEGPS